MAKNKKPKTFNIIVWWSEAAVCKVQAESLEAAKEKVLSEPDKHVPAHGTYIDDSLTIDHDQTEEFNS